MDIASDTLFAFFHISLLVVDRFASGVLTLDGVHQTTRNGVSVLYGSRKTCSHLANSKICKDRAGGINYTDANGKAASASMLIEEVEGICGS